MAPTIQPVSPSFDSNHNVFEFNIIGKSQGTYGLIHAYTLRGTDNVASNNIGFAAPKLLTTTGGGVLVKDGGGNQSVSRACHAHWVNPDTPPPAGACIQPR